MACTGLMAWFQVMVWNGRMSLEHYKGEHALDSETILKAMQRETEVVEGEQERAGDHHETNSGNRGQR